MSKIKDAKRSILQIMCPLKGGLQYFRMMMERFLRRFVFRCLRGLSCERLTKKRRLHRSLACILMTKDR
jgi:hypothetical protein